MSGKYTKNTKKRLIQNIQSGRGDLPTVIKIPKQYYGVITKSLGISSGDQKISNMPNPPQTIFEAGDYIPIVRNGQNYKLPLSSLSGIIQSLNFLTTSNMLLKSGNAATLQITDDGLGNIVFTVIGGGGGGFDPTQNIIFSGTDSFTKALTVPTPTLPGHAVNVQYLEGAKWTDQITLGVNPTSGLTQGLVGGENIGANIPSLANPSYVLLNPATTNFGGFVNMKIYDVAGDCYINFAIGGTVANIVNYQGAGAYTTLAGFQAAYKFYKDSNNYLYIQPVGTVTNFICSVVNGFNPLSAAQIPNIGTIQPCNTPLLVTFSQLTAMEEMQSTIDSLTARLEALESPKTPLKAAKK